MKQTKFKNLRLAPALLGLLTLLVPATQVSAQCDFNAPAKAKGIKADMVRAFVPCGNSITLPAPNSSTMAGTPTCTPVTPRSSYRFGPKGSCKLLLTQRLETPCSTGCGLDCANLNIRVRCKALEDAVGLPISEDNIGWALSTVMRVTGNDLTNGDMTVIDFPLQFSFPPPTNGKLKLDTTLLSQLLFDPCLAGPIMSPCAAFELLSARVVDPEGSRFATMGASTR